MIRSIDLFFRRRWRRLKQLFNGPLQVDKPALTKSNSRDDARCWIAVAVSDDRRERERKVSIEGSVLNNQIGTYGRQVIGIDDLKNRVSELQCRHIPLQNLPNPNIEAGRAWRAQA